ncbi:MAG: hypothetical protein ACJ77E_06415 [Gaiellaceae bacterium]
MRPRSHRREANGRREAGLRTPESTRRTARTCDRELRLRAVRRRRALDRRPDIPHDGLAPVPADASAIVAERGRTPSTTPRQQDEFHVAITLAVAAVKELLLSRALLVAVVVAAAALAVPMVAEAASSSETQLSSGAHYDTIASALAGFPVVAVGEDDYAEWSSLLSGADPHAVLGFTHVDASPSSSEYHHIYLAPPIWSTLQQIASAGVESVSQQDAAQAILTLTHESYHLRLDSSDEGRVNACALRDFGSVLVNEFAVPQTVEQSRSAPVTSTVRVRQPAWQRIHGKRVRRYVDRYVSKTTYAESTATVANPTYDGLVAAAQSFVASQPPPYNSGTCF